MLSEALDRLRLMAGGSDKWDLSPNDRRDIALVLARLGRLEPVAGAAASWLRACDPGNPCWQGCSEVLAQALRDALVALEKTKP